MGLGSKLTDVGELMAALLYDWIGPAAAADKDRPNPATDRIVNAEVTEVRKYDDITLLPQNKSLERTSYVRTAVASV